MDVEKEDELRPAADKNGMSPCIVRRVNKLNIPAPSVFLAVVMEDFWDLHV
jgi:hypothetical protein